MENGESEKVDDIYILNVNVKNTTEQKAKQLLEGMQGLVNDLGVDQCLDILGHIKKHPEEFSKCLSLLGNQAILGLLKNF